MNRKPVRSIPILICIVLLVAPLASAVQAQEKDASPVAAGPASPKPKRDKYGSPLDTLMTTHLWTEVPPARDFVTQTRPDVKTLDYAPLTGSDPDRPKPRDAANISALRAELEGDAVKNERKAHGLRPASKPRNKPGVASKP